MWKFIFFRLFSVHVWRFVHAQQKESVQDLINKDNFRTGVQPYCNEKCPVGYDYIPELGHCYRLLADLGPTSQDRGVEACGLASGLLVGLDQKGDEDFIRTYFWNKYGDRMQRHCNYLPQSGFWTAYLRKAGDGVKKETQFVDEYVNLYTEEPMPVSYFRETQPNNERFDQACVARKWFNKEWIRKTDPGPEGNGLDDYVCGFPHWVVCQVRKEFALNMRGYNLQIQASLQAQGGILDPESDLSRCEQDWTEQTKKQFQIMIQNASARNNQKALDTYAVAKDSIQNPSYAVLTG